MYEGVAFHCQPIGICHALSERAFAYVLSERLRLPLGISSSSSSPTKRHKSNSPLKDTSMLLELLMVTELMAAEGIAPPEIRWVEELELEGAVAETSCRVSTQVCVIRLHTCLRRGGLEGQLYHELAHYVEFKQNGRFSGHRVPWKNILRKWGQTPRENTPIHKLPRRCRRLL